MNAVDVVQFALITVLLLTQIALFVALSRTREAVDVYIDSTDPDDVDETVDSIQDLNTRLAQLQKSKFSYMGTNPDRKKR